MAKLFIANGTNQIQDFHFRLPGAKQVQQQKIAIGGQELISGDLTEQQITAIVNHHGKYGMIPASEIGTPGAPAPYAFQVDKAFTSAQILTLVKRNHGELVEMGRKIRENAAVIVGNSLGKGIRESGTGVQFTGAEIEITEETKFDGSDGDGFNEKTIIERTDRQGANRNRGRNRN